MTDGAKELENAFMEARNLWQTRLKAARKLKAYYKDSDFAETVLADREKEFKRKWWEACNNYETSKKLWGKA